MSPANVARLVALLAPRQQEYVVSGGGDRRRIQRKVFERQAHFRWCGFLESGRRMFINSQPGRGDAALRLLLGRLLISARRLGQSASASVQKNPIVPLPHADGADEAKNPTKE